MTPRLFLTADTHFGHANIVRYAQRPFASIEAHDEALIANWNATVAPGDIVYHLGDFAFASRDATAGYLQRLHGQVFLIEGNHDKSAHQLRDSFGFFKQVHELSCGGHRIWLSHYAHRVWPSSHHGTLHCYGHSHNSLPEDPSVRAMDVGVDAVAALLGGKTTGRAWPGLDPTHYRPIEAVEVIRRLAGREFRPVDHHGRGAASGSDAAT